MCTKASFECAGAGIASSSLKRSIQATNIGSGAYLERGVEARARRGKAKPLGESLAAAQLRCDVKSSWTAMT